MLKEYKFTREGLKEASEYAWSNQMFIVIHPKDMNLIEVLDYNDNLHSLITKAKIIDTVVFAERNDFDKYMRSINEALAKDFILNS